MPMPNRQMVGGELYRYGYQGEFAETDTETGKPAFQLRIYDPRIGRWLTVDPMGQYHSPYMAMDNRPNMSVDPTGGCTVGVDCPKKFDWMGQGTFVLDEVNVSGGFGIPWGTASITGGGNLNFRDMERMSEIANKNIGKISQWNPTALDEIQMFRDKSKNGFVETIASVGVEATYGLIDGVYLVGTNVFSNSPRHLNGFGVTDNVVAEGGINVVMFAGTQGAGKFVASVAKPIKSSVSLWNSFQKATVGSGVPNSIKSAFYKQSIKVHNQVLKLQYNLYSKTQDGLILFGDYKNEANK